MMETECVRVAVNIRPLITSELLHGCTDCISVVPGEPQVQIGSHCFTYDFVYGSTGLPSSSIYDDCVAPLVDALFHGYNATVLAYGQTGSGKTYTMGTNYNEEVSSGGIIPRVIDTIFDRIKATTDSTEFLIRVSFIEIFKEEVFDLLDSSTSKGEATSTTKVAAHPTRVPIQIRETLNGEITLAGVTEADVKTKDEMALYLSSGSLSRATGSTNMNSQSSRSHAIFTISMEQKNGDDILCSKLHLVDLAGSERVKRTGAGGLRLKEGIHINKGLLALGNVISALGDEKKRKEGGHVPYRDSKLTRLLQDSLGGNSKTVMIACVSPADTNAEETLNTLKYANRARNIQNKAIINRDPAAAQMQTMRNQIEQLQAELLFYRGDTNGPIEEVQILKHKISLLEASNAELKHELKRRQLTSENVAQRALETQVERDQLLLKIESLRNGKSWEEIDSNSNQDYAVVKSYVSKIQDLEGELLQLKTSSATNSSHFVDCFDSDDDGYGSKHALFAPDEMEDDEKELEHSSIQEKLDKELKELDKKLEQKEAEMKLYSNADALVLRHHYEKKLLEMEQEKKVLQKEIEELKCNLADISSTSDDGSQMLKQDYLQKLNALEAQVSELKRKQEAQAQLLKQKQKTEEFAKGLQDEIHRIKAQKVNLQNKIKQESEQFRLWKASREKEVLQLKKEGRKNEFEMHKLVALNQRQKMVLQRKTEEASLATKRLKELLESRKASSREATGVGGGNGLGVQALMKAIEHEIEVNVRVHEVRSECERQKEVRAKMAEEMMRLKKETQMVNQNSTSSDCPPPMSPGARHSRIFALQNMLSTSSATLVSMLSQLSEAEEQERIFSGKGRWSQVRSLADAKNMMNYLFNIASSSRCSLRDKEVIYREKEMEIRDLKEKVVGLSYSLRQSEKIKAELSHKLELQNDESLNSEYVGDSEYSDSNVGGHKYDLCNSEYRRSSEDMDIYETESEYYDFTDDEWEESGKLGVRKRKSKTNMENNESNINNSEDLGENSRDFFDTAWESASDICCSCSRTSLCNTTKCACKAMGSSCGNSCGCQVNNCANRASISNESKEGPAQSASIEETDKDRLLVTQGAELLQGALVDRHPDTNNDHGERKPLSDIGNTQMKSNAKNENPKRKLPTSTVIIVPYLQPENLEVEEEVVPRRNLKQKKESNSRSEANVGVNKDRASHRRSKSRPENAASVPRAEGNFVEPDVATVKSRRSARRSSTSNTHGVPLWDRNASTNSDQSHVFETRTPVRYKRTLDQKENNNRR
ncbi:kinesin-like protein KIN-4C [Vigna unguiculata]|uniref:kinesin-like protein KIN-4C n=1 Tax=Vigna unguiculata TaxID=3917 RepID=UPI001016C110|nr:kinesin-like protein KIN-4C [Vigna unguiculata]